MVRKLLLYAYAYSRLTDLAVPVNRRRELLLDAFTSQKTKGGNDSQTSFGVLVKKLQESLTRMESFDVITITQGLEGVLKYYE